jgi:phospholipid-binding lipoprotein MlaA
MLVGQPAYAQTPAPSAPVAAPGGQLVRDPLERENRGAFAFSMAVDQAVIAPLVRGYLRLTPRPVAEALGRAIHNFDEPRIAGNDILQGHFKRAGSTVGRFVLNSTIGVGGLFDPATRAGLPRHESDFGQTLGRYGVGTGPYIYVPFVGPSDLRDGVGRIADALGDPLAWATGGLNTTFGRVRFGASAPQGRVDVNDQIAGLRQDFADPYAGLRSEYSQNRALMIRDARGESATSAVQELPEFGPTPTPSDSPPPAGDQQP